MFKVPLENTCVFSDMYLLKSYTYPYQQCYVMCAVLTFRDLYIMYFPAKLIFLYDSFGS